MFFQGYSIWTFIGFIVLTGLLILFNEISRHNKLSAVLFYIVFPLVMTCFVWPFRAGGNVGGTWFAWVKTYSALAGVLIFMGIRYNEKLASKKWMLFLPAAILGINILEAVAADFECAKMTGQTVAGLVMKGGSWNYMNAIAGILLTLTMTGTFGIRVSRKASRDMVWPDMGWPWIIAYDLWNLSYCYNCISNRSFYAGMVLLISCTLAEFALQRGIWLQHRAQTLALFAMFSLTFDYSSMPLFAITSTQQDLPKMILAVLSLVANVALAVYELNRILKMKKNPLKEDLYTDLNYYRKNLDANLLS